jgi:hypothetical protein
MQLNGCVSAIFFAFFAQDPHSKKLSDLTPSRKALNLLRLGSKVFFAKGLRLLLNEASGFLRRCFTFLTYGQDLFKSGGELVALELNFDATSLCAKHGKLTAKCLPESSV